MICVFDKGQLNIRAGGMVEQCYCNGCRHIGIGCTLQEPGGERQMQRLAHDKMGAAIINHPASNYGRIIGIF